MQNLQIKTNLFLERGFLVQPDLLNFLDQEEVEVFIEILITLKAPHIISLDFIKKNKNPILTLINSFIQLNKFNKKYLFNLKQKLEEFGEKEKKEEREEKKTKIIEVELPLSLKPKKPEVKDFINFFKFRFDYFKELLKDRKELTGLISLDKLPKTNQNLSIIGMVFSKRETKNKNLILELEDKGGVVRVLIRKDTEVYKKALDVVEDEVIGVKGFGNKEIIFASDLIFPEILNLNKKSINKDKNIIFISDVHIGSLKFLESNFKRFIKWINGELGNEKQKTRAKKVTHMFIVGDLVDGVGIYPDQEEELAIKDIKEQYRYAYELFDEIRKDVKLIFLPGNHDAVRLVEPQIFTDQAKILKKLSNAILKPNPSYFNLDGLKILLYHGYSLDFYANQVYSLKQQKAYENPEVLLKFLLSKRHLAPTHGSTLYMPYINDFFIINKVPDLFVTAHIHKTAISNYRNILLISSSCWQARTSFQERVGHIPDPCKVPILNLKTKKINLLDFS